MKKLLGTLFMGAALVACGGGGGDSTPSIYEQFSKSYACVNVNYQPVAPTHIAFTSSDMSSYNGTTLMHSLPFINVDGSGNHGYGKVMPDNRILVGVLYPAGISGTSYHVSYSYTYPGTSTINENTIVVCQ